MKKKTAKRFLTRNAWKISMHNRGASGMPPSMQKRVKEATRTLVKEK